MVFAVYTERVEQLLHIDRQGELVVLLLDGFDQRLALFAAAGIEFQQTVATAVKLRFQALALGAGLVDQQLIGVVVTFFQLPQQTLTEAVLQGVAGRAGVEEGVQCLVIPLEQAFLRTGFQIRHVQLDGVLLADAVETADALLEKVRMRWQIEQHQMVAELEVAAFTADFRADQHLRAKLLVGEVGRGAVALEDAHALVEHSRRNAGAHAQRVFQIQGGLGMGADDQHLVLLQHLQRVDQPFHARIELPPAVARVAVVLLALEGDLRIQLGMLAQRQFEVFGRAGQRIGMQLALRETLHGGTGVAEQQTAGAVTVEQLSDQPAAGLNVPIGGGGQQGFALGAEEIVDSLMCLLRETALVEQLLHGFGHRLVAGAFGAEGIEVVKAIRIEQTQTGEVAVQTELFRSCSQQQHAGDHFGQLFDQFVFGAGTFRVPDQVVRFVHYQHVPAGGKGGILGAFVFLKPFQRYQCQLGVFERVAGIALDETLGIEQCDFQVEAAAHLHQPLVLEVFRNQDQHPAGAA